ncbi:MAG: hypothetical protein R2747_02095 [Pyrinomonadaceae bacterium]
MKIRSQTIIVLLALCFLFAIPVRAQICGEMKTVKRVTNRSAGKFEYVIFDLIKKVKEPDPDCGIPDYEVEDASPPFTDYPGDSTIPVNGGQFKKIRFHSINAEYETSEKLSFSDGGVADLKQLWAFEGESEWALGYGSDAKYLRTYYYDVGPIRKIVLKFRK